MMLYNNCIKCTILKGCVYIIMKRVLSFLIVFVILIGCVGGSVSAWENSETELSGSSANDFGAEFSYYKNYKPVSATIMSYN